MFIGREFEQGFINDIFQNDFASILVVYGRRRIGKTALIEKALENKRYIKIEGKQDQGKQEQIKHALYTLSKHFKDPYVAKLDFTTWTEVFDWISQKTKKGEWVLYLEELQWLAEYKEDLISDLKVVWDNDFSKNPKFRLVLCGSAPSYMLSKVVRSKALHNRSQYTLPMKQFSVKEVKEFFRNKKSDQEVMDAYLTVGGIPEYLKYLKTESSVYLGVAKNSFNAGSFFSEEYEKIFVSSLSTNPNYRKVIEYLAKNKFATREEILTVLGMDSGGTATSLFQDLEDCDFIRSFAPYNAGEKSRLIRYHIADNYLQFYYKFIAPKMREIRTKGISNYQKALPIDPYRQWLGYSFERWCRSHHELIAKKLGFEAVEYQAGAFFNKQLLGTGFQIDLLFDRKDRVITVCELKYNVNPITTSVVSQFEKKIERISKKKNQSIQRVLIAAGGAEPSVRNYFDRILTLEDLI